MYFRPDAGDRFDHFIKVTVGLPRDVARTARLLEQPGALAGLVGRDRCYDTQAYETNVAFPLRFMVDQGIVGGGWVRVAGSAISTADHMPDARAYAGCTLRLVAPAGALVSLNDPVGPATTPPNAHWSRLAHGMRTIVMDVCTVASPSVGANASGTNEPPAEHIAVVACACRRDGQWQTIAFARRGRGASLAMRPAPTQALIVVPFASDDEAGLVRAWHAFFHHLDPDVVVGYEVSEHLELLLARADALGLRDLGHLGRFGGQPARIRSTQIYSANWVRSQRRMASTSNHEFKVRPRAQRQRGAPPERA